MTRLIKLSFAAFLFIGLVAALNAQQFNGGGVVKSTHTTSFCAAGCDSTGTTWTVPYGAEQITALYCGSGAAGAGGYNSTTGGGGGGGGGAMCVMNWPIAAAPGTVITFTVGTGPTGGAINTQGTNGASETLSWTSGAWSYTSPAAFGGQGNATIATSTTGGTGGASGAVVNGGTTVSGLTFSVPAGGAGATGNGTASGQVTESPSSIWAMGGGGGGGGGATNGNGGSSRLVGLIDGASGFVLGGAGTTTCGGGGAGGNSWLTLGGTGGTVTGNAGNPGGTASGGGGGPCNGTGGAGGQQFVAFTWVQ